MDGRHLRVRGQHLVVSVGDEHAIVWKLFPLHPLKASRGRNRNVFVVEFGRSLERIQIGRSKGFPECFLVKGLGSLKDVGHNFVTRIGST